MHAHSGNGFYLLPEAHVYIFVIAIVKIFAFDFQQVNLITKASDSKSYEVMHDVIVEQETDYVTTRMCRLLAFHNYGE